MKKNNLVLLVVTLIGSTVFFGRIFAQEISNAPNITYPVQELNNCKSEADCRAYCDLPQNVEACVDFGEKNNLMSKEEVQLAKKFIAAGAKGPGGCQGKEACEEYCDNIANLEECLAFGEKNNLMSTDELAEAKKVQAALKRGVKMPNCNGKKACDVYCEEPDHIEECVAFGMEAGFIQGKELEDAQKMMAAIKKGVRPPPCRGKEACDEYCSEPANMEMCMSFAIEAGFMSEQEAADSQKMLAAVKQGVNPPKCRGKEECDNYCSEEEHFEECMNFAEAAGFMSSEEAVMARKTKGKTPGNCKGREQCEAFCNDPANQETCFNFAKENGLISEEDLQKMGPPGGPRPDMQGQNFDGQFGSGSQNGQPQTGPGGCTNPEECRTYCEANPQDCQNFGPPPQQRSPDEQVPSEARPYDNQGFNGPPPGMNCSSREECQRIIQEQMQNQVQPQSPPPEGVYPPPSM